MSLAWWLLACASSPTVELAPAVPIPAASAEVPVPAPIPVVERVELVAVGDVLPHRAVKATARDHAAADNHDGWDVVFADVAELVGRADIAFANLESPVAPDAHRSVHGEVFNAPPPMLTA